MYTGAPAGAPAGLATPRASMCSNARSCRDPGDQKVRHSVIPFRPLERTDLMLMSGCVSGDGVGTKPPMRLTLAAEKLA